MENKMPKTQTAVSQWEFAVQNAAAHKQLGQTDIYLSHDEKDFPWAHVTSVEAGGSHRLNISTSVSFRATHPSGLTFRWSYDIEPHSANGSGHYHIDVAGCQRVLALLPMTVRREFRAYLAGCAAAVLKSANEYQAIANKEQATADALNAAAAGT
jgi:hypothetical protein